MPKTRDNEPAGLTAAYLLSAFLWRTWRRTGDTGLRIGRAGRLRSALRAA